MVRSLENFEAVADRLPRDAPVVTSPRSVQVCMEHGYDVSRMETSLIAPRPFHAFATSGVPESICRRRCEDYERARKERVAALRAARQALCQRESSVDQSTNGGSQTPRRERGSKTPSRGRVGSESPYRTLQREHLQQLEALRAQQGQEKLARLQHDIDVSLQRKSEQLSGVAHYLATVDHHRRNVGVVARALERQEHLRLSEEHGEHEAYAEDVRTAVEMARISKAEDKELDSLIRQKKAQLREAELRAARKQIAAQKVALKDKKISVAQARQQASANGVAALRRQHNSDRVGEVKGRAEQLSAKAVEARKAALEAKHSRPRAMTPGTAERRPATARGIVEPVLERQRTSLEQRRREMIQRRALTDEAIVAKRQQADERMYAELDVLHRGLEERATQVDQRRRAQEYQRLTYLKAKLQNKHGSGHDDS